MNTLRESLTWRVMFVAVAIFALTQMVSADESEDYLKDLHIRQMPMATELTPPPVPAGAPGNGLAVNAWVDRPDQIYSDGETLILTVETTEDAYVWVFDTGTSGKVHQIFPNKYETANFLAANTPLSIPKSDSRYQLAVSHPQGAELITIVASKDKVDLTPQQLIDTSGGGAFLALCGNASSVAKDLSITLRKQESAWVKDEVVVRIR